MKTYSLTHKADQTLLHDLNTLVVHGRADTAEVLAHIAEVEARGLYREMGYSSMFDYCVEELHFSEHAAYRRIGAARTARRFPALFSALAEGRLHLCAVGVLSAYLTTANAEELIAAAIHKPKAAIELMIAQRFPKPDLPTRIDPIATQPALSDEQLSPQQVQELSCQLVPGRVEEPARPKVAPLAPQRFGLQMTISKRAHDKLRYAQELLSHELPSGDVAQLFEMGMDALIAKHERIKFAATEKPRGSQRRSRAGSRYIPRAVKRAVWKRDGGQCTFVSRSGHRCSARKFVEFDHLDEVARGGKPSLDRIRLRCHAHNQFEAERTFGAEFMRRKREQAKQAAAEARERAVVAAREKTMAVEAAGRAKTAAVERAMELDITFALKTLGYRAEDAKRATAYCDGFPEDGIEARVRRALAYLRPRVRTLTRDELAGMKSSG